MTPLDNHPESRFASKGRSIVLVGLMGAGKTCVGRKLATRLGLAFLDADAEIEAAADCTVSEIFERYGEAYFRDGERRVIARLLGGAPCVLATGGGAFMDPQTREEIAKRGLSVWIQADLELLVRRTARKAHRPLLRQGDPREILARLKATRDPVYALADIRVQSSDGPPEETVEAIVEALEICGCPRQLDPRQLDGAR